MSFSKHAVPSKRIWVACILGLSLLSAGSGPDGDDSGGTSGGDASTLVLAAAATPTTLDPEFSSSPQDREIDVAIYDRFTQFQITEIDGVPQADLNAPPEGLLAESWDVSEDGLKYTFHLRRGVESFVGNELTADDVIWSWHRSPRGCFR
jgi:peptide/nickel transport system substrate-binding protein